MSPKVKHLEMIQSIVSRLAGNLFYLKGWVITIIGASLALILSNDGSRHCLLIIVVLTLLFWVLDGYYLSQERLFRDLYNAVRIKKDSEIDFSMNIGEYKKLKKNTLICSMFSFTTLFFYLTITSSMLIVWFLTKQGE